MNLLQGKNVFFVENAKDAIEVLEKNIDKLQLKKNTKIYFQNVLVFIGNETFSKSKFDLIFCDPPFKDSNIIKIIEYIYNNNMLKNNGIVIIHRNKNTKEKFPNYFKIIDERIYGISKVIFGKFLS